jgi:hypothetical protein
MIYPIGLHGYHILDAKDFAGIIKESNRQGNFGVLHPEGYWAQVWIYE